MQNGILEHFIHDIKPGRYSIIILDDENKNNDLDKNWLGIPTEGFGFSKNVKPTLLGAPDFEKCVLDIGQQITKTKISIQNL